MSSQDDKPNVIMLPPLIFGLAIIVTVALDRLMPQRALPHWTSSEWTFWPGVALAAAGISLGVAAIAEFRRVRTNISPHLPALQLVERGVYRLTRNPMYLGMILLFAGLVLVFGLAAGPVTLPLFALTLHWGVVRREESYLTGKFGKPYLAFLGRTRRWL